MVRWPAYIVTETHIYSPGVLELRQEEPRREIGRVDGRAR